MVVKFRFQGLRLLEYQMSSSLPPQVTAKGKEIRVMMKGIHIDLDPIIEVLHVHVHVGATKSS